MAPITPLYGIPKGYSKRGGGSSLRHEFADIKVRPVPPGAPADVEFDYSLLVCNSCRVLDPVKTAYWCNDIRRLIKKGEYSLGDPNHYPAPQRILVPLFTSSTELFVPTYRSGSSVDAQTELQPFYIQNPFGETKDKKIQTPWGRFDNDLNGYPAGLAGADDGRWYLRERILNWLLAVYPQVSNCQSPHHYGYEFGEKHDRKVTSPTSPEILNDVFHLAFTTRCAKCLWDTEDVVPDIDTAGGFRSRFKDAITGGVIHFPTHEDFIRRYIQEAVMSDIPVHIGEYTETTPVDPTSWGTVKAEHKITLAIGDDDPVHLAGCELTHTIGEKRPRIRAIELPMSDEMLAWKYGP